MVVNTNGCVDKAPALETMINYINPDSILVYDSKIDSEVQASQILPEGYQKNLTRKDWNSHGGRVFVATKDKHIVTPVENTNTACESAWADISLPNNRSLKL